MLSNDEIQKIIDDIESGAYDVADVLEAIANAAKGEDVRAALYASVYSVKNAALNGQPKAITTAENMRNTEIKYLYLGNEDGFSYGYIYAYVNGEWVKTNLYGEGAKGFSPSASVMQTQTGAQIIITDEDGTTTANVNNGTATDAQVEEYIGAWLDEHPEATTTVEDESITEEKLSPLVLAKLNSGGMSADVKAALLECFRHIVWLDDDDDYYDTLYAALYPPAGLLAITAVYTQTVTVFDTDSLDVLKQDLVVTAHYDDGTTSTVTSYTLSGTLAEGTSTIAVSFGGKSTTISVTVTVSKVPAGYTELQYLDVDGATYIATDIDETVFYDAEYKMMRIDEQSSRHIMSSNNTYYPYLQKPLSGNRRFVTKIKGSEKTLDYAWDTSTPVVVEIDAATRTLVADGTTLGTVNQGSTASSANKYYLFAYGGNPTVPDYRFKGRFFYMKLWNSGDLVHEFIPAQRTADSVKGLYDTVAETFITPTSGTFG